MAASGDPTLAFILDVDDTLLKEVAITHRVHECAQLLRYKPSDANVKRSWLLIALLNRVVWTVRTTWVIHDHEFATHD